MLEGPCACCAARRAGETAVDHPTSSVKGPRRRLPLAVPSAWTQTCSTCPGLRPTLRPGPVVPRCHQVACVRRRPLGHVGTACRTWASFTRFLLWPFYQATWLQLTCSALP